METTEAPQNPTEEIQKPSEEVTIEEVRVAKPPKKERSELQKKQFDAARAKAVEMRKKASQERADMATKAVVQAYSEGKLDRKETEEDAAPPPAKPRKKAIRRRIMVVEQTSSESEADSEVEIILPPKRKQQAAPEEDSLAPFMQRMFSV